MSMNKNLWCQIIFWKKFAQDNNIYIKDNKQCKFGDNCRGAHNEKELIVLPEINKFNAIDKTKFNWVKLYLTIKNILEIEGQLIKNEEHIKKLSQINNLSFIGLVLLWKDLARHYRKIRKNNPLAPHNSNPIFHLNDFEDMAWSFSRILTICPVFDKIKNTNLKITRINEYDLCLAPSFNCREGVHEMNELLCFDDFLNGDCKCPDIKLTIDNINKDISETQSILETYSLSNDFKFNKRNNPIPKLQYKINNLYQQINDIKNSRKLHYSELGVKPFNLQLEEYNKQLLECSKSETQKKEWENIQEQPINECVKVVKKIKQLKI